MKIDSTTVSIVSTLWDDQDCLDIMTTAHEGGCVNYWTDEYGGHEIERDEDLNVTEIRIPDLSGDGVKVKNSTVDIAAIREGIATLLADDIGDYLRGVLTSGDAGEVDANIADCIVQAAALGEEVYC